MVVIVQYMAVGMLVKPLLAPSTICISVPMMSTIISATDINTMILKRLCSSARPSDW